MKELWRDSHPFDKLGVRMGDKLRADSPSPHAELVEI
jgi:hypothetical protein